MLYYVNKYTIFSNLKLMDYCGIVSFRSLLLDMKIQAQMENSLEAQVKCGVCFLCLFIRDMLSAYQSFVLLGFYEFVAVTHTEMTVFL